MKTQLLDSSSIMRRVAHLPCHMHNVCGCVVCGLLLPISPILHGPIGCGTFCCSFAAGFTVEFCRIAKQKYILYIGNLGCKFLNAVYFR